MNPDKMRKIDALAGPFICFALSVRRGVLEKIWPRKKGKLEQIKRMLFVKPAEMGSTILMYSMLKRARELWPDIEFHFLVFAENAAAVKMLGMVQEKNIHTLSTSDFKTFVCDSVMNLLRLRRLKFDVAIDLEFFSRASAILTELVGAKSTCGFNRFTMEGLYKGNFFSHPVQYNAHIHTAQTFYSMIDALLQPAGQIPLVKSVVAPLEELQPPRLQISAEDQKEVKKLMRAENPKCFDQEKLIIINANSSELVPLRRWPLEKFIELGRELLNAYSCTIVLTGVASERAESEKVEQALGRDRVCNMVGKTSLDQLLVLYSICDLMITNDSGPSHFASLTDLAIITLFGPETPKLYGPLGRNKIAITANLACSPCVSSYNHRATPCNDNLCMKKIEVPVVLDACRKLLNKATRRISS
ncbi:MAG: lipopolysaccharide heptosyltransferase I [Candidatus Rifleibacteriota bacterium]